MSLRCNDCQETINYPVKNCPVCMGSNFTPLVENLLLEMNTRTQIETPTVLQVISSLIPELDAILGGGIYEGNQEVIYASPGVGKTTHAVQFTANAVKQGIPTLFVSNEMSEPQLRSLFQRYQLSDFLPNMMFQATLQDVENQVRKTRPKFVVFDSLQTLPTAHGKNSTWNEMIDVSDGVTRLGKKYLCATIVISQVNHDGKTTTGPNRIKHNADIILRLEKGNTDEVILTCEKNRQAMTAGKRMSFRKSPTGLIPLHENETGFILRHDTDFHLGTAGFPTFVGGNVTVDEVTVTKGLKEQLIIVGTPQGRNQFLEGVIKTLYPTLQLPFVVSANRSEKLERASDLAIVIAVLSKAFEIPLPVNTVYFGALDASGKILVVSEMAIRTDRAISQGYPKVIGPRRIGSAEPTWIEANDLREVIQILGLKPKAKAS